VLAWIQAGGEERAGQLEAEETRAAAREQRLETEVRSSLGDGSWGYAEPNRNLLGSLVNLLGEGWTNLFDR